ncbi:MAG: hypothetical protein DMG57_14705 [Acidobacteria bacterium]|nr:MAG: hypothetical protein DMG57_14705 [Acidobacteriota bacterium]
MVPVGFIAVFTNSLPERQAGWLLGLSQSAAAWHAHWEPNWRVPDPPVWLAIGISAALVATALLGRLSGRKLWHVPRVIAISSLAALLVLMVWHPFPPDVSHGTLEMTAIDVGQGQYFSGAA